MNFIEIKNEYITSLCDIITQYIYQGFQSIYENALNYKRKNNVEMDELRIFQDLLRNIIPNWSSVVLEREVARIKICSKKGDLLDLLLKMIIKAQLYIYFTDLNNTLYLKKEIYENINFNEFIHKVYINAARELFNNPFLFKVYEVSPKDIKINQKETFFLIKESIKLTVRNLIPLELLLQEFVEFDNTNINVKLLTEHKKSENNLLSNIKKLELDKKELSNKQDGGKDIPLINTIGENVMEKVFSTFNIKETLPNLVDINDVHSVVSTTIKLKSHHTLSNFLKESPKNIMSDTIKQSAIEDYDAIYNNDN